MIQCTKKETFAGAKSWFRSDDFTVQRMEQNTSNTHSSSFVWEHHVVFIDLYLKV